MRKIILILGLVVVFVGASFWIYSGGGDEEIAIEPTPAPVKKISVYVSGQVKTTAVVTLEDTGNLRLVDAVNAVGGLTDFADTAAVNLAEPLTDGQHIHIPTKEIFLIELQNGAAPSKSGLININTADERELQNLDGIGPALAARIVDYRNQNGKFKSIDEIKKVRGIADKKFAVFKDNITVQ